MASNKLTFKCTPKTHLNVFNSLTAKTFVDLKAYYSNIELTRKVDDTVELFEPYTIAFPVSIPENAKLYQYCMSIQ